MITAVIGAQYGSEGKGKVVQHMAKDYDIFVRVGGPNAGHVVYFYGWNGEFEDNPKRFVMRSVPCGWLNPHAKLVIGAGAVISLEVLEAELAELEKYDPIIRQRLYIDGNAMVITEDDTMAEQTAGIKKSIGSTGEGVGYARIRRITRDKSVKLARNFTQLKKHITDTQRMLYQYSAGTNILLEGTQGSALSLYHGDYPYCTSADTNVAQLLADCGIAPSKLDNVVLVVRSMPIRVGGHSGPLAHEVNFKKLKSRIGQKIEHTSVTKKVRRIGLFDMDKIAKAARLNKPTHLAFMFADYDDIQNENIENPSMLSPRTIRLVDNLKELTGAEPLFVSTGIHSMMRFDTHRDV